MIALYLKQGDPLLRRRERRGQAIIVFADRLGTALRLGESVAQGLHLLREIGLFAADFGQHVIAGEDDVTEMLEAQAEIAEEQNCE